MLFGSKFPQRAATHDDCEHHTYMMTINATVLTTFPGLSSFGSVYDTAYYLKGLLSVNGLVPREDVAVRVSSL